MHPGPIVAWIEIPSLSSTANTVIYMYYGNASASSQQNITGTWNSSFNGVYHLNNSFLDATSNNHNGTNTGTTDISGMISNGRRFLRSNGTDYITINGLMGSPANLTLSAWASLTTADPGGAEIISIGDYALIRYDENSSSKTVGVFHSSSTWNTTGTGQNYAGTGWHYVVYTFDNAANTQKMYIDGALQATTTFTPSINYTGIGTNTFIGKHGNANTNMDFDGTIDEVRVSNASRTAGWVLTEYNNQNSPSTFWSVGSEGLLKTWDGGAGTNNWGDANNWDPNGVPTSNDNVNLTGANTININVAAVASNLTLHNAGLTLTIIQGNTLVVSGNLTLTSGVFNISGMPTITGTVNVAGGTVGFFGTVAQTVPSYTYNNLTFNNTSSGGATLSAAITGTNVLGNISVQSGTFNNGGFAITLPALKNFSVSNGATFNLTGTSAMVTVSGGGTKSFGATSTTKYTGGAQTISPDVYGNLVLSSPTANNKTFTGATTIASNFSISGSAVAILPNGSTSTAQTITLGGVNQATGSWGGTLSSATNKSAAWFGTTTTGILNVNTGCLAGTWLGIYSTDWNDAGNWCGGIPTATTDVIIPSAPTNQPIIGAMGGLSRNLTINTSATLTISGAYTLTLSGHWANSGTFTSGTSTVNFNLASGTQTLDNGTSQFYKLTHSGAGTLQLLTNSITINSDFLNSAGTVNANNLNIILKGTWSNSATFTAGSGTVSFTGTSSQLITGTSINSFNNLTINNTSGVTSSSDFTVNGILHLQSANASASLGTLSMGTKTLTMGGSATTIGVGDVTGIIKRISFVAATAYTFGNQYTTLSFQNIGTLPTSVSIKIVIGSAPAWKTNGIFRTFEIIQTGGTGSFATFNTHYLDSELNGNIESNLVFWISNTPFVPGTEVEIGRSNFDFTNNWIGNANIPMDQIASSFGQSQGTLGNSALVNFTWNGSVNTTWNESLNWTPNGVPSDLSDVIIPDAGTTSNDPLLPAGNTSIGRITINSNGILNATATSSLTITGANGAWISIGGIFNPSTSTVIFTNAAATISGITNFYNLMINSAAGLTMGSSSTIRIAGAITNNGTWNVDINDFTTVEYNGVNQTVLNPNGSIPGYHNLILSGSGTKTMPGSALTIHGDLSMSGTAAATALATMTIAGGLTLGSGTTFITGALSHSIGKNFTNNGGTFTATGSTITLNGVMAQTLGGTTSSTFNNLILNNIAGALLGINETVGGILTLTNGKITTGSFSLVISNTSTSAISGASSSKYINGNLQLSIAAGANTYAYPIGTATVYAPVSIAFTSGTIAGTLTGFTTNGDHPSIATSTLAPTSSVNRFWGFVINSGLTTANYGATYNWVAADQDPPFTFSTAVIGKFNMPTWTYPTIGTRTSTSIQITGATAFGDFQVANGCSAYTATLSGTGTICSGSSSNIVVTLSGGISPYTVVYTGDGGGTITNYISGTSIPVTPASNTTYALTSVTDAGGCLATISGSGVTITLNPSGTWTGATGTDWNTSSNWCGGVPTSSTDVIITSTPVNQPVIGAAGGLSRNITIGSGATLTITGVNTLTVSGNWTRTGTFVANSSNVIFNGTGAANIGTSNFNNVTFSGAGIKMATGILTIAGNVNISNNFTAGSFTHTVGGNWTRTGTFAATGSTIDFNGSTAGNIGASNFNNITFSGAGTKTATGALTISGNVVISNNFTGHSSTLTLSGNWTNNGTFTSGGGTIVFNGVSAQTISGTSETTFASLTISNTAGVIANLNLNVNGVLNLPAENPSASSGSLAIGVNTLTMGASATTIGVGDVSGIVRRTSFIPATTYTFGNQFTSIVFQNIGTLPSEVSLKITLGSPPSWKTGAINRIYAIIQTGAVNNIANLNAHYLDSELNGNTENTLVFWRAVFPFTPGTGVEFGRSNFDVTNNWISLSSIPFYLLPTTFGQWEGSMASSALPTSTWNGSVSTIWVDPNNWTPNGVPSDLSDVIIPDSTTTPNDPITNVDGVVIKTMTIQSGGILNALAASTITIKGGAGAWSNTGGIFNASTSTVIFTNAAATISGVSNFFNVTIDPAAALINQTGSITRIAGTMINNGIWHAALNPDNTVEYNGVNQTVLNPNGTIPGYDHLILSGTGTKTMPGTSLIVSKDFSMSGTASATAGAVMTVNGNFTLGAGTTFNTGAFSHSIGGNFTNDGATFNATGSTITFNGPISQTLGGTNSSTFDNLAINNSAGVILGVDETVSGILTFTTGIISTGIYLLKIDNVSTSAIAGASPSNYVNGNLSRFIGAGANTYSYPIGTSIAYAPASITFAAGTVAGELTGTTQDGDQPNIASSTLAPTSSVNRFWRFTIISGLTTANYGATFNWVSGDQDSPFDYTTAVVGKYTSATWSYPAVGARTQTSIAITGASGFGDFQVANGCSAFTATLSGPTVICSGSEDNLVVIMSGGISPYTVVYSGGGGGTIINYISGSNIPVSPSGITTYTLIAVTDAGGCTGTVSGSPAITISLNPPGTWLGTTDTDWNTASNWCGGVPTSTTDVNIPAGGNQPVIGAAGGVTRNLTINPGATLTITGLNTLTNFGNWTNAGTFIANSSTVIFDGPGINNIGISNFYNVSFIGTGPSVAAGALTIEGDVLIGNNFNAAGYTHTVAGNWTDNGLFTAGSGTIIFNGISTQTISGSIASVFNNLTINNGSGVVANSDLTVNKVLNLQSNNPSLSIGNLSLGAQTLTLGSLATVIGMGDVTGIVKRSGFTEGVSYSFGNQYTTITFQNTGTLPTDFSIKTLIGAAPAWKTDGILRVYEVIQNGAVGSYVTINVHYLGIELNGNIENDLVYWYNQYPFATNTQVEVGKANYDLINDWVGLSSIPAQSLPTDFGQLEATLGGSELTNFTWNGSVDSEWLTPANWSPNGTPSNGDDVIIPDSALTPNDPTLPSNTWTIGRLTIQNGGVLNADASSVFTISGASGAWINIGGTFNANGSTIVFSNPAATISGITDFYSVTIDPGASLTPGSGSIMRIAGTITNNGIWDAAFHPNTVEYNGGDQIILNPNGPDPGYSDLILSGSGTKTMPGTLLHIGNDFTMSGSASATANAAMDVEGTFTLNSGTTFNTDTNEISLDGDFINNGGSFNASGSDVELDGTALQTFGGTTVTTFDTLTINNAAGILLQNDEIISGALVFISGIVATGGNTLTIDNAATNAISGASVLGYVNGNLCHDIMSGANSYLFPIGTSTTYAPVTIDFLAGTIAGTLCSSTTDGDYPAIANSILNPISSINRYWSFNTASGLGTANYDALFNWVISDQDPLFVSNTAIVGKFDSPSTWSYPTIGNHTSTSIAITGASGFSEFLVADACVDPDVPTIGIAETSGTTDDDGIICDGDMATLSITGGVLNSSTEWEWYSVACGDTPAGTGISIMVSPSVTTTYYVRGEGGCVTPGSCASFTITVNPLPDITNMSILVCSTVGFSVMPVNGTDGVVPAGTTYSWSAPSVTGDMTGGTSGSGASSISGTLTNPTSIDQTATYTVDPGAEGCPGNPFTVTVTVYPSPVCSITGPDLVCPGTTTDYEAPDDMTIYTWTLIDANGASIISVEDAQTVSVTANTDCAVTTFTLQLTTTDVNGCQSICTIVVTQGDGTGPIVTGTLEDITVEGCSVLDAPSNADNAADLEAMGVSISDGCTANGDLLVVYSDGEPDGTCPIHIIRTYVVSDTCGNPSADINQNIYIDDTTLPVLTCPTTGLALGCNPLDTDLDGIPDAVATSVGWTDNCSPSSGSTSSYTDVTSVLTGCERSVTREFTYTDGCGNIGTCQVKYTWNVDTTGPVITTCPPTENYEGCNTAAITSLVYSESAVIITLAEFTGVGGVATDACGIVQYEYIDTELGSCPTVVTRHWTVTDGCGNTGTCEQMINIDDSTAPSITGTITTTTVEGCGAGDATAAVIDVAGLEALGLTISDACTMDGSLVVTSSDASAGTCPIVVTRTYSVTDACSNTTTATQIINVDDETAPTIACPSDVIVNTDGGLCTASGVSLGVTVTGDNCGVMSVTNDAPLLFPEGNTIVIWTVTDNCGNTATCAQNITVTDNELPTITCAADQTQTADPGECNAVVTVVGPTTGDNCGVATIINDYTGTANASGTYPTGTTTVLWTVTDLSGNTATCAQDITVTDNELPTITCAADQTQTADAGECNAVVTVVGPTTDDNCGVATVLNSFNGTANASGTYPTGTTTVLWTVTDLSGNTATCAQDITVTDNELPTITCAANQTQTADAGECNAVVTVVGPTTGDNCGVASVLNSFNGTANASGTYPTGTTTVLWTVTDLSGNTATCAQDITVTDNELPTITCAANQTQTADAGECNAAVTVVGPTTGDNCGVATIINDFTGTANASGTYPTGTTTVLWTVTDLSGNTATCAQDITVTDNELPTITCAADQTQTADAGECNAAVTVLSPTTDDNCGVATVINRLQWNCKCIRHLSDRYYNSALDSNGSEWKHSHLRSGHHGDG